VHVAGRHEPVLDHELVQWAWVATLTRGGQLLQLLAVDQSPLKEES
jgi:hypothetical protein